MINTLDKAINAFDTKTYKEYNSRNKKDYDTFIKNQNELDDIKAKAIKNGTFMKAPNGNQTNLTEQQWLQVRTKAFKDWFGNLAGCEQYVLQSRLCPQCVAKIIKKLQLPKLFGPQSQKMRLG